MPQEKEKKSGRIEGAKDKSIEIAKKLLKIGMSIGQIETVTQLSKEEIEKIIKEK